MSYLWSESKNTFTMKYPITPKQLYAMWEKSTLYKTRATEERQERDQIEREEEINEREGLLIRRENLMEGKRKELIEIKNGLEKYHNKPILMNI